MHAEPATRFKSKFRVLENGCWRWLGATNGTGYGVFRLSSPRRMILAHRFSYECHRGPIPAGLTLDHLCRNCPCVNPDHLEIVTLKVNILRGFGPTSINARKVECPEGHPYDSDNVFIDHVGSRRCRQCVNAQAREYRRRMREERMAHAQLG